MDYIIREILQEEYGLLEHFLYEAIFVPEGMAAPPESITKQPELQVYLTDFGEKKDDIGLVAEVDSKVVGAVWVRIMNDYGHVNDATPSFAISLYKEYRGLGIGLSLIHISLASAPLIESIITQFFFPMQNVRIDLSEAELSIGTSPSLRNTFSCFS